MCEQLLAQVHWKTLYQEVKISEVKLLLGFRVILNCQTRICFNCFEELQFEACRTTPGNFNYSLYIKSVWVIYGAKFTLMVRCHEPNDLWVKHS